VRDSFNASDNGSAKCPGVFAFQRYSRPVVFERFSNAEYFGDAGVEFFFKSQMSFLFTKQ